MASTDLLSCAICVPNRPPFSPHIFSKQTDGISCCSHLTEHACIMRHVAVSDQLYIYVLNLLCIYVRYAICMCGLSLLYISVSGHTAFRSFWKKTCAHGQMASHFERGWFSDRVSAHHQMAFLEASENTGKYAIFVGGFFMPSTCDCV